MKNNIILICDVEKNKEYLGSKTVNLKKCDDWGFSVPKFVALPSFAMEKLFHDRDFRQETAREAAQILGSERYSVRSSAMIEDSSTESFAGQFKTVLKVSGDDLSKSIYEVIEQAEVFLKGDLGKFSIIIQEYIAADISGVTFTRNPNGSREMVVEYGFCEGEKIVSGKIQPNKISFYWETRGQKLPKPLNREQIEKFKELEKRNKFPQDIEWCYKGKNFYLLQSRPITTISPQQYGQIIFLDEFLPKDESFFYQKTDVSEMVPRPTNITLSLLKAVYSQSGPVAKVYKKYGVAYKDTDFLKIIGNELFIDREREIKGILPAYGYFGGETSTPKIRRLSGLVASAGNLFNLNRIKTGNYETIYGRLKERIEAIGSEFLDVRKAVNDFIRDYELVFEVNLMSGVSMKRAELLLRNCQLGFPKIVAADHVFVDLEKYGINAPRVISGNSIELSDETAFVAQEKLSGATDGTNREVSEWWATLGKYKKDLMRGTIEEAIIYSRFREFGRWLVVKGIDYLRRSLLEVAGKKCFRSARNIYFADLDAILSGDANEPLCVKNRENYELFNGFNFSGIISSEIKNQKTKIISISPGVAQGILMDRGAIEAENDKGRNIILYTEMLSPDLTKYFGRISGIVSNNGGLLSHLAIIAREKHIPVVSGIFLPDDGLKLGDFVRIDGGKGEISEFVP